MLLHFQIDYPDVPIPSEQRPRKAITSMNLDHVFMSTKPSSSAASLPPKVPETNGAASALRHQIRQNGGHHKPHRHFGKGSHNLSFDNMPASSGAVAAAMKMQKDDYSSTLSTMEKLREVETVIARSEYLSSYHSSRHPPHGDYAAHHQGGGGGGGGGYYTGSYVGGPVVVHPPLPHRSNSARSSASSSAYSGSEHLPSTSTADGDDDLAGMGMSLVRFEIDWEGPLFLV